MLLQAHDFIWPYLPLFFTLTCQERLMMNEYWTKSRYFKAAVWLQASPFCFLFCFNPHESVIHFVYFHYSWGASKTKKWIYHFSSFFKIFMGEKKLNWKHIPQIFFFFTSASLRFDLVSFVLYVIFFSYYVP